MWSRSTVRCLAVSCLRCREQSMPGSPLCPVSDKSDCKWLELPSFILVTSHTHTRTHMPRRVQKSRAQAAVATKLSTLAHITCGPSIWTLLYVTLLAPIILRWFLYFRKVSTPLYTYSRHRHHHHHHHHHGFKDPDLVVRSSRRITIQKSLYWSP
jgi:hypothetical protein